MRILVVGAGAVGGYFGGRLLEAGRDVTFLVRPRRASELAARGLRIRSAAGDAELPAVRTVLAEDLREPFDLVILTPKSYDLESAMEACAPAVGERTAVLPMLNGMRHLDVLAERFGGGRLLGGRCLIGATVGEAGEIVHLSALHTISFGERAGGRSERVDAIARQMEGARCTVEASEAIVLDMWEKWVFLATLAGCTCLMRASTGDILASPGGRELVEGMLEECRGIAAAAGYAPREASRRHTAALLLDAESSMTASMMRDIERGSAVEGDHIIGDLLRRASGDAPCLRMVYTHLRAYEARRARETAVVRTAL